MTNPTTAPAAKPTPDASSTTPGPQPLLDLTRLVLAIRRRRRLWVTLALLGLIVGGAVAVVLPTSPTAVTRIYVVHEDDQPSDSGNLVRTDVTLMDTARIAAAALERVGSRQRPENFLQDYDVVGVTNNVLEVTVRANTNADAIRRAKALADVFIADHIARIKIGADAEAKALIDQRDRVQKELNQVNGQISGAEAAASAQDENNGGDDTAQPNAAGLDSLYARRAELTSRVSDLSQQAEEASIGAPRVTAGTQIIDAPRVVPHSAIATAAANCAIGLLLGLVAGWALAAVTGVVKDRPVLRKDIAANLGASVIAQLPAPQRGLARLWRRGSVTRERIRVAATLTRLVRDGTGPVSLLELGARRIAAALALDVATELAHDRDVVIIEDPAGRVIADDLPGRRLDELTGRTDRRIRIIGAEDTSPTTPGEARVGIGSAAPGTAWTDLTHLGEETLLVVRTGFANTAWLHTVARQLADARIPILGIVLVAPDPRDRSDGTLWDGLHTALRGRTGRVPVPVPAKAASNGTKQDVVAANGTNGTNGTADLPTRRFAPVQPHLRNGHGTPAPAAVPPPVAAPTAGPTAGPTPAADPGPVGEKSVHDLPTKRFAPVRAEDVEDLLRRRNKG
ncbi:MAG: exopolysaccharide biosynthesis protein [Actinophytocola sp.]|uniref:Wzz/FepE/Etk N-terminal domain-containing protein n=1 Tax=Actinophytocola sp. TaxID=1872138 RepID=UPI00132BE15F|nr:Wzz/FepE/Etk N-terminal domain-containing protein [Actinophytocola sp.]MPZ79811.1 exopolysaccharide biosynthesis protein [Actinophytocola sp.]